MLDAGEGNIPLRPVGNDAVFHLNVREEGEALEVVLDRMFFRPVRDDHLYPDPPHSGALERILEDRIVTLVPSHRRVRKELAHHFGGCRVDEPYDLALVPERRVGDHSLWTAGGGKDDGVVPLLDERERGRIVPRHRHPGIEDDLPPLLAQLSQPPIKIKNVFVDADRLRMPQAHAQFVNVLQCAPVKVLAAEKDLHIVDDEVLGVLHSAGDPSVINNPHLDVLLFTEEVGAFGISFIHPRIDEDPHGYAPFRRPDDCLKHLLEGLTGLVGNVKLLDIE